MALNHNRWSYFGNNNHWQGTKQTRLFSNNKEWELGRVLSHNCKNNLTNLWVCRYVKDRRMKRAQPCALPFNIVILCKFQICAAVCNYAIASLAAHAAANPNDIMDCELWLTSTIQLIQKQASFLHIPALQ